MAAAADGLSKLTGPTLPGFMDNTLRDIPTHAGLLVSLAWKKRPDLVFAGGLATLAYAATNVWFLHELAAFVPTLLDLPDSRHIGPQLVNAVLDALAHRLRAEDFEPRAREPQ